MVRHMTVDERVAELAEEYRLRGFGTAPLKVWVPEGRSLAQQENNFAEQIYSDVIKAGEFLKDVGRALVYPVKCILNTGHRGLMAAILTGTFLSTTVTAGVKAPENYTPNNPEKINTAIVPGKKIEKREASAQEAESSFMEFGGIYPCEPLTGILSEADKADGKVDGQATIDNFRKLAEDRGYAHLINFDSIVLGGDNNRSIDAREANAFLIDRILAYLAPTKNKVRHSGIINLVMEEGVFKVEYTDSTDSFLEQLANDPTIGYKLGKHDLVVRIFQKKGAKRRIPVAAAKIGANGYSTVFIDRDGNVIENPSDIVEAVRKKQLTAELSYLDRGDTYDRAVNSPEDGDVMHVFDVGEQKEHKKSPKKPGKKRPKIPEKPQVDKTKNVDDLVDVGYDAGAEGIQGKLNASEIDGPIDVYDGDQSYFTPSEKAKKDYGNSVGTRTKILDADGNPVYGSPTVGTRIKNTFRKKENEQYVHKVRKKQSKRTRPVVLNSNNGSVYGTNNRKPDEVRWNYISTPARGGITVAGRSYTRLGGQKVNKPMGPDGRLTGHAYQAETTVAYGDGKNPTVVGTVNTDYNVLPVRNSTVAFWTAVGMNVVNQAAAPAKGASDTTKVVYHGVKTVNGGQDGGAPY